MTPMFEYGDENNEADMMRELLYNDNEIIDINEA